MPGALVVRLLDLPGLGMVRWTGGLWWDIHVLHVAAAHGLGNERVERVFRLPWMSSFTVEELRRRIDGSFMLTVQFKAYDEESPLDDRHPEQTLRSVIHTDGIDILRT